MIIFRKIHTLLYTLYGFLQKILIDLKGHRSLPCLHHDPDKKGNVVVSLTSFGRRVHESIVYYTLVSILRQKQLPDRIILWLDNDNWNDVNLPKRLKKLRDYHGVEIRFCEDLRSYKKLIPTLRLCPEDIIITIDDDIIYHKKMLSTLLNRYKSHENCITSFFCVKPCLNRRGKIQTYRKWPYPKDGETDLTIFPIGCNAVLYPPHSLHEDVFDTQTFQTICPTADDIWFWIQAVRKGTLHHCIVDSRIHNHSFDALYQLFHQGSALMHANVMKRANESQLEACMEHYSIDYQLLTE